MNSLYEDSVRRSDGLEEAQGAASIPTKQRPNGTNSNPSAGDTDTDSLSAPTAPGSSRSNNQFSYTSPSYLLSEQLDTHPGIIIISRSSYQGLWNCGSRSRYERLHHSEQTNEA